MSVLRHKVRADLVGSKGRLALVVLSIAAGVFAVGGIFGMVDLLLAGMDRAHRAVHPSHLNVILRGAVTRDDAAALARLAGVAGVEPVNQLAGRARRDAASAGDDWELATLVMRDDYRGQAYDVLELVEGAWPGRDRIGVERLTAQWLGLEVGDEIELEANGRRRTYEVGGVVRHPFVRPPRYGGQACFFLDRAELAEGFGVPSGRYGQLLVQVDRWSPDRARTVAGELRAALNDRGADVAVTLFQDPDRHWGRRFAEGVTVMLQIIAVVSLVLSVLLVMTMMTATVNQQITQIGVIKAVGGRRRDVVVLYLTVVVLYGLLALALALPAGVAFAHLMTRWFLNLFNIDAPRLEVSEMAIGLQLVAALAAPAVAALQPVLRGARITVREAVASYGLGGDFGSSALDRAVERVGARLLSTPYAAALGNMFRRKGRLALTLFVLVIGGVLFQVVMSLVTSTELTLDNDTARRRYDVVVGVASLEPAADLEAEARAIEGVTHAEVWFRRNALVLREGEDVRRAAGLGAQLLGLPSATERFEPIVVAGRWLRPGDGRAVVLSAELAEASGIELGDRIGLGIGPAESRGWEVVGLYRLVVGGGFALDPAYAPLEAVQAAFGAAGRGNQVYVESSRVSTRPEADALANRLRDRFAERGLEVDAFASSIALEDREAAGNQFRTVIDLFLVLALLIAVVGGIGLAGSLGIAVVERIKEIGVMRALGAGTRQLMSLFVLESLLQGLLSWAVSVPLAWAAARPLAVLLGQTMLRVDLDYDFDETAVFLWLLLVTVVSILAAVGPAWRATRISVRESLAYQ